MEYNPSQTMAYLAGKVDEYVKFQGRDTIKRNTKHDRNCRYARIPDGGACDFCRMLGSRGFVYHTEESAGGVNHGTKFDTYHPYCNCQIAVCFDPFVEEYYVGWTKVTRGYGDGQVTVTGRDKSDVLRQVDIDELYDEYKRMAKDFNKGGKASKYKDYTKATKLSDEDFDEYMKRLSDVKTLDELYEVAKDIESKWPDEGNGRDKAQWEAMKKRAKELERQFKNADDAGSFSSGAIRGTTYEAQKRMEAHARLYYEELRNRDIDYMLSQICEASGLSESEARSAFNHLLVEEHDLDDGRRRFDPDYEISQSIQRILEGREVFEHDRLLFRHEALEAVYMKAGKSYDEAHYLANLKYNYENALNDWLDALEV